MWCLPVYGLGGMTCNARSNCGKIFGSLTNSRDDALIVLG